MTVVSPDGNCYQHAETPFGKQGVAALLHGTAKAARTEQVKKYAGY